MYYSLCDKASYSVYDSLGVKTGEVVSSFSFWLAKAPCRSAHFALTVDNH